MKRALRSAALPLSGGAICLFSVLGCAAPEPEDVQSPDTDDPAVTQWDCINQPNVLWWFDPVGH